MRRFTKCELVSLSWQSPIEGKKKVRIVVVSDTHHLHREIPLYPHADIFIHCGDFTHKRDWKGDTSRCPNSLKDFNNWLGDLPYKYKIVIAGNHEIGFNNWTKEEIRAKLSNAMYLQDEEVTIEGIKFYGTPWTTSSNMGFSISHKHITDKWKNIPLDTDILISHLPPHNILDLAYSDRGTSGTCTVCGATHPHHSHWGDENLRDSILNKIKPKVHLFGHNHDENGHTTIGSVTFINSASELSGKSYYFDFYPELSYESRTVDLIHKLEKITVDSKATSQPLTCVECKTVLSADEIKWQTGLCNKCYTIQKRIMKEISREMA